MIPLQQLRTMKTHETEVAAAMDSGTSEGVKKSWLKRERAQKEAAIDAADNVQKTRIGSVKKPRKYDMEETSDDFHDRIAAILKKFPVRIYDNATNNFRQPGTSVSFSLDINSTKKDAEKCVKGIKEALEEVMPKCMIDNFQFSPYRTGAVTTGDDFERDGVRDRRIVVLAINPSIVREDLERANRNVESGEASMKVLDEIYADPDRHFVLDNPDSLHAQLIGKKGKAADPAVELRGEEEYFRRKMGLAQYKQQAVYIQRKHDRVVNAFTTGKYEA